MAVTQDVATGALTAGAEPDAGADARARESEARLIEAQRLAKVGDWQWDVATGGITWSRQTYVTFGRSPLQPPPTYEELRRYYAPASWATLDASVQRALDTGEPYELELEHLREDGTGGWQLARGEAVRDATGRIVGLRGTAQDICERKRVEQALRDSERRYATMFHRSHLAKAWTKLPEGTLADVNDAWVALVGIPREEAIGRTAAELGLVAVGDRRRFYEDVLAHGSAEAEVTLFTRAQGHRVVVTRAELVTLSGKQHLLGAMQDVTDARRAAEALRESEERARLRAAELQTVLDTVPAAVWTARDARGDRIEANRFGAELLRRRAGENVSLTSPGQDRLRHFEVQRAGRALGGEELPIQRAARGEEIRDTEIDLVFDDGEVRHMLGSAVPVRDDAGRSVGSVGAFIDVTERKRAEARSESLARFPEENPDPVLRIDAALRVLYANRAALGAMAELGLAAAGPAPAPLAELARRALTERRRFKEELPCGDVVFAASVVPVGDEVNVYAQDITARKHAEEALRGAISDLQEADRRKTEFLAVLSHELRNPLAPIRNGIHILERAAPGSAQASRAKEVVRRQTEHLTRLVDDLLDAMRIEHGKVVLQRARVDLREIVQATTDDLRSLFAEAGVELHVEHVLGPVWIDADATRVAQALGNLLNNAVKFTPRGGTVALTVRANADRAELRVRDSGVGIDAAMMARLFVPFAQAEQTLARTGGGLGLGLALVKGLVELHGGTVEARSDGRGTGAEFIVRLPLAGIGEAERGGAHPGRVQAEARLILVVEDNVDAAESLADILALDGHRVRIACDGRSGIALARELRPDVVLCDIGLPDIDGHEVARALRSDEAFRDTRLVALSGYAQPEDVAKALEAGFDVHLAKPPEPEALERAIARCPRARSATSSRSHRGA